MARFRYSLQGVLDIKLKMETQAKQEFSAAKNTLDEEKEKLEALRSRKSGYEATARKLLTGTLNIMEIEENKEAILRMDEYIARQNEQVRLAAVRLEQARENLSNVVKERKTHESLRQKAFEEFLKEENSRESKAIDELTSYTYGKKRQVDN